MAIESDKNIRVDEGSGGKSFSSRSLIVGALIVLIVGAVAGGWAMTRLLSPAGPAPAAKVVQAPAPSPVADTAAAVAAATTEAAPVAPAAVDSASALAARVADLETRLSRITLEAASASGNATRAEGLLIAFAARRALDRGLSLGYLEAQLRLRFGDDQPNAVKTIIDTSRDPVTLEQLRSELDTLAPDLVGRSENGDGSLWTAFRREMGELFVVRPAGTLSPRASERLERARRYLAGGQVDKAIDEVQAMPGAEVANDWLMDARRYHEARRALDLIETAAILEPRDSPPAALARSPAP
ncbi:mitofilin family membrane protein [Sphingopyxis indica]|uniref:Inner membrane protein n=1 Tax=Sphingopyxis indica TaxID=436663 RepID=A0A239IEQ6_9SPHN|nr:mitofilin family membrane protein [Sphingopyxis indica]SNS91912.1 inner membrane protein [Sphingopyxis indica]